MSTTDTTQGLVTIRLGQQWFGVPVLQVQDVIAQTRINHVPLAPPEVAGSLNLRGRIVTAIDLRRRMRLSPQDEGEAFMCVIIDRKGELYALLVDDVGDVVWLSDSEYEANPVTLPPEWRSVCEGLYRQPGELLLVLNIDEVLTLGAPARQDGVKSTVH